MPPGPEMTEAELRDQADDSLTSVVQDMNIAQSPEEQSVKSRGHCAAKLWSPLRRFTPMIACCTASRSERYQVMKDLLLDLQALRDDPAVQAKSNTDEHGLTESATASLSGANAVRLQSGAESVVAKLARHKRGTALALVVGGAWWAVRDRPGGDGPVPNSAPV